MLALLFVRYVGPELWPTPPRLVASAAAPSSAAAEDRPMEVSSIDDLDAPDGPTAEEKAREEKVKKEEEKKDQNGQVVDIAQPAVEQRPDDAKYLAEYDSRVDHEKKGPTGRDKAGAKATPAIPAVQAQPQGSAQAGGKGGKQGDSGTIASEVTPKPTADDGHDGLPTADDGEMLSRTGRGHSMAPHADAQSLMSPRPQARGHNGEAGDGKAQGGEAGAPKAVPNLMPTPAMLDRAIGQGSGSMDYLKNMDDGDSTALNAKKFKFASFFNRVKRQVQQEWNPATVYVRHDPTGNVYGVKDRVTVLRVNLSPAGDLIGSNVVSSSGVDFLDDEAVSAFKRSQPYGNPPKELVEADGQIHFTFAFIFELSGKTSFRVQKYNE
ncbi:MAG: energy transducer TonB [Polyangia bacterium]